MELTELSDDPTIIRSNESVPLMGEEVKEILVASTLAKKVILSQPQPCVSISFYSGMQDNVRNRFKRGV